MFENIGGKIKALAQTICWIGIILSIIVTLILLITAANTYDGEALVLPAFIFLIIGTLTSWIGSFFMYGFGELIEKTCEIAKNTSCGQVSYQDTPLIKNQANETSSTTHSVAVNLESWKCSKCGSNNSSTAFYCKDCGNYK